MARLNTAVKRNKGIQDMDIKKAKKPKTSKDITTKKPQIKPKEKQLSPRAKKEQVIKKIKILWESLRRKSVSPADRQSLVSKIINASKSSLPEYILSASASRIVQTVIKFGDIHQRLLLFDILKARIPAMLLSKYGKHILLKFIKYGGKLEKETIFKFMSGKILQLVKHAEASVIVEQFYSEEATKQQQHQMLCEFYGPSYILNRTSPKQSFVDFISSTTQTQRESMLKHLKDIISPLIDRASFQSSLVHKLVSDYINCCSTSDKKELMESLCERLPHIMHTLDGSKVAITCINEGTIKDRDTIVKQLKTLVCRAALDDHGHLVLVALLSRMENTELLSEIIISELMSSIDSLFEDKYGFRLFAFILLPTDERLVPGSLRAVAALSVRNTKEQSKELFSYCRLGIMEYIESHVGDMAIMKNRLWFLVAALTIVNLGDDDIGQTCRDVRTRIFIILADIAVSNSETPLVEHPTGHLLLKHLISATPHSYGFANVLMDKMTESVLEGWIRCNRGCFVIVSLFSVESIVGRLVDLITPLISSIKLMDCSGAKVLVTAFNKADNSNHS